MVNNWWRAWNRFKGLTMQKYLESGTKESSTRLKSFIWCMVFVLIDLAVTTAICIKIMQNHELLLSTKFLIFLFGGLVVHFIMIYFPQYLKELLEKGMTLFGRQKQ